MCPNIDLDAFEKGFRENGYYLVPPQWSVSALNQLRSEAPALFATEWRSLNFNSASARELNERRYFLLDMRLRSRLFAEFLRSEPYRAISTRLIGPDVDTMYDAVIIKPAGKAWRWTSRWVIPRSHLLGKLPHVPSETTVVAEITADKSNSISVEMEAGCILVLHPLVLHSSGPNLSSVPRLGYVPFLQEEQPVFHNGSLLACSPLFRGGQPSWDG